MVDPGIFVGSPRAGTAIQLQSGSPKAARNCRSASAPRERNGDPSRVWGRRGSHPLVRCWLEAFQDILAESLTVSRTHAGSFALFLPFGVRDAGNRPGAGATRHLPKCRRRGRSPALSLPRDTQHGAPSLPVVAGSPSIETLHQHPTQQPRSSLRTNGTPQDHKRPWSIRTGIVTVSTASALLPHQHPTVPFD
jgi:hypothetical protein